MSITYIFYATVNALNVVYKHSCYFVLIPSIYVIHILSSAHKPFKLKTISRVSVNSDNQSERQGREDTSSKTESSVPYIHSPKSQTNAIENKLTRQLHSLKS